MTSPRESEAASILIIEDELDIREVLAEILTLHGHHVETVRDGQEALDRISAGLRPDVILLDLMMPVMDGWAFQQALLERPSLAGVPIVVLSGVDGLAARAAQLGAAGFLRKPIELAELLAMVGRFGPRNNAP